MQKKEKKNDRQGQREKKSFLPSKKYREKLFTDVYECVKNDMYPLQIAEFLSKKYRKKWTKQRVNHWLNGLVGRGLIEKTMKSSFTKYAPCGTSKNFIVGDERVKDFDLHNIEITIPLFSTGNLPEGNIEMNNWKYCTMKFGEFTINVNYGKEPKLKIYPPNTYGNIIDEVLIKCGSEVRHIVAILENNYKCRADIKRMEIVRKPHLHPNNDKIINQIDKEKIQYTGKFIEFNRSGDAHADILGFEGITRYDQLLNIVPEFARQFDDKINRFSENIESHLNLILEYRKESIESRKESQANRKAILLLSETISTIKDSIVSAISGQSVNETIKETEKTPEKPISDVLATPGDWQIMFNYPGDSYKNFDMVRIRMVKDQPGIVFYDREQNKKNVSLKTGAVIFMPAYVSRVLIKNGKAEQC